jgi:hypothetical protein
MVDYIERIGLPIHIVKKPGAVINTSSNPGEVINSSSDEDDVPQPPLKKRKRKISINDEDDEKENVPVKKPYIIEDHLVPISSDEDEKTFVFQLF